MAMPADTIGRDKGAVVPAEQVTYLHYLSSHQRRLQHLLEEEVRANRLALFVAEADRFCYIDMVKRRREVSNSPSAFSALEGPFGNSSILPNSRPTGSIIVPLFDQLKKVS
jgi:hypothetical protein